MKPELNTVVEEMTLAVLEKLPKKNGKTIVSQSTKTEIVNKETGETITRTYNYYDDGSEECLNELGKKATW